jgi:hypothetical protein
LAAVHAAGGDVGEEFAQDEVERDGVLEIAAEGEEFGADIFGGLELEEFAMVEEAEFEARGSDLPAEKTSGGVGRQGSSVRQPVRQLRPWPCPEPGRDALAQLPRRSAWQTLGRWG